MSLRDTFLPNAAGFAVWATLTATPFTIANTVDVNDQDRTTCNMVASAVTLPGLFAAAWLGGRTKKRVRRRLTEVPMDETDVLAMYLQKRVYGHPQVVETLSVTATDGGYTLRIRNGAAKANEPKPDGTLRKNSVPEMLRMMGFDLSGVTFVRGGETHVMPGYATVTPLEYTVKANSLPIEAQLKLEAYRRKQQDGVPAAARLTAA